ncbi:MAG: class I SAM-dependent methyltransferase, partial [Candidatus Dormibacteraceae bacterium]
LGAGSGRLLAPLRRRGIEFVAVDAHPLMADRLRQRLPGLEVHVARLEELHLEDRFDLVMAPSNLLTGIERLLAARRFSRRWVAFELVNPHWLAAGAGGGVEVKSMDQEFARLEIRYQAGYVQAERTALVWPERVEDFLDRGGLELVSLRGVDPSADLEQCPSYLVLASRAPAPHFDGVLPGQ